MPQDPVANYKRMLLRELRAGRTTEASHRSALKALVESFERKIVATNEPKREKCGAPDFVVAHETGHGPLTIGHLETKDVGVDLAGIERDSERTVPVTRNGEQLRRFRGALENLIITDYLEFRWYGRGELRETARLGTLSGRDKVVSHRGGGTSVRALLSDFLAYTSEPVSSPRELAERMARLTHLIRDVIVQTFETGEASDMLRGLHQAFAEVLIPDLSTDQFADMFAQTLAYGLFAARVEHEPIRGRFQRVGAAREIPKTNPFLRKLFGAITGPDLDDEPYVGLVDDLTQLLADTDMSAILIDFGKRTRQEDPVFHFYETFLAAYDPKIRERRGVYYTPEPVVSYIVRSVDELLRTPRFQISDGLADTSKTRYSAVADNGTTQEHETHRVLILDPACGTGTFLYSVVDLIRERFRPRNVGQWSAYVRDHLLGRLFGFELMMAPYAVAHLKLGMQLAARDVPEDQKQPWVYDFAVDDRMGIYLTNSLEEAVARSELLFGRFISEEANAAAQIKRDLPIMVVLGNPPYSGLSANASWRWYEETIVPKRRQKRTGKRWQPPKTRRTRRLTWIGELMQSYYQVDGQPLGERNPKWLQDDYVKFLRFGQWRIDQSGAGILAMITNHAYLDNPTFRGMRQQLMQTFTEIYVLDLHGNKRKKERAPDGGPDKNVFDIQQGVAIGIFVKLPGAQRKLAAVHHADLWGVREVWERDRDSEQILVGGKYHWLSEHDLGTTSWTKLRPEKPYYLFVPQDTKLRKEYERGWSVKDAMLENSVGIVTARDSLTIKWSPEEVLETVKGFASLSAEEARDKYGVGEDGQDWKVSLAQADLRSHGIRSESVARILYRPFDQRWTYYTGQSRGFIGRPRPEIMNHMLGRENLGLHTCRQIVSESWRHVLVTNQVTDDCYVSTKTRERGYLFPVYLYPEKSKLNLEGPTQAPGGRRPNFVPKFIEEFAARLNISFIADGKGDLKQTFGPEDMFHYIYAILHSPAYRERYAEVLRTDFPRVPLTSNHNIFRTLRRIGAELAALHLMKSPLLASHVVDTLVSYPERDSDEVEPGHPRYLAPGEPDPQTGEPLAAGRVYISRDKPKTGTQGQYFEGIPREVWEFRVGGYQLCQKWLKDRRGRTLSYKDQEHYKRIVVALEETVRLMREIDAVIPGWPLE